MYTSVIHAIGYISNTVLDTKTKREVLLFAILRCTYFMFSNLLKVYFFFSIVLDAAWRSTYFELHPGLIETIWRTRMFCLLHFIRPRHQRLLETMDYRPKHLFNVHQSNHKRKLSLIWVKLITCFHDS